MRIKTADPNKELSEQELDDLKHKASEVLSDLRREMIYRYPFCGAVSMSFDLVPTRDESLSTAATDGKAIYFDIAFLSNLTKEERIFVFAHEIWHNCLMHFMRNDGRDREVFNIATDCEVNQLLRNDGLTAPESACFPEKFGMPKDLSAEEYYELLMKSKDNDTLKYFLSNFSNASSEKNVKGQFDSHIYEGDDANDESAKSSAQKHSSDKYGKVGKDDDYKPNLTKTSVEKVRESAIAAAQQLERQKSDLPEHIKRLVGELLEPEVSWQDVLSQFITRSYHGDKREWNPPNRRHVWNKTYLQSRRGDKLKIVIGIDTSGSTSEDMPKFLSEVNGLVKSFSSYEMHLIQCDAEVGKYDFYDDNDQLDIETDSIEITGGGGTRMSPIIDYVNDNELDVDCLVIFTDGEIEEMKESASPDYPVLWVICKNGTDRTIHFGEIVKLKQ